MFDKKLVDFSQSLAGASDKKTLFSVADRALADYGCDHLIFADVAQKLPIADFTMSIFQSTMPAHFWDVVKNSDYKADSVKMRRFLTRNQDSFWDDLMIAAESTPAELAHTRLIAEAGFQRGYFAGF